jgi:hypothetical protein
MSVVDDILGFLGVEQKIEAEFAGLEERVANVFGDIEQELLKIELAQSIQSDLEEGSEESLERARDQLMKLVEASEKLS